MGTTIRRVTPAEFERLFRHGFEVADYTLYAYHPDTFPYIGYVNSRWGKSAAGGSASHVAIAQ
ncbi:MAG: hypothetical protein A2W37_10640 [Chloroflexi bacterium RBG_16_63_12]|nr:MAG: hypothetical protein A2W37_10640 [Chloroflexi bacterium RBG_16_63_12]